MLKGEAGAAQLGRALEVLCLMVHEKRGQETERKGVEALEEKRKHFIGALICRTIDSIHAINLEKTKRQLTQSDSSRPIIISCSHRHQALPRSICLFLVFR